MLVHKSPVHNFLIDDNAAHLDILFYISRDLLCIIFSIPIRHSICLEAITQCSFDVHNTIKNGKEFIGSSNMRISIGGLQVAINNCMSHLEFVSVTFNFDAFEQ